MFKLYLFSFPPWWTKIIDIPWYETIMSSFHHRKESHSYSSGFIWTGDAVPDSVSEGQRWRHPETVTEANCNGLSVTTCITDHLKELFEKCDSDMHQDNECLSPLDPKADLWGNQYESLGKSSDEQQRTRGAVSVRSMNQHVTTKWSFTIRSLILKQATVWSSCFVNR